jgi:hypothetical protein
MLTLKKSQLNQVALSAAEQNQQFDGFFLFVFTDLQTKGETKVFIDRLSTNVRYCLFEITEGTTVTLAEGKYRYEIYLKETNDNTNTDNLQPSEVGMCVVVPNQGLPTATNNMI